MGSLLFDRVPWEVLWKTESKFQVLHELPCSPLSCKGWAKHLVTSLTSSPALPASMLQLNQHTYFLSVSLSLSLSLSLSPSISLSLHLPLFFSFFLSTSLS